MSETGLAERFIAWAQQEPSIDALVQIGSRVRANGSADAADGFSDWDFQVVTRRPALFDTSSWMARAGLAPPLAYAVRGGRLGRGTKVTALFGAEELDLVLIPRGRLGAAKWATALGLVKKMRGAREALGDLAVVLRPGFRVLKGADAWEPFLRHVVAEMPLPRLDDAAVRTLAECFVCDYVSTKQKISRGELAAAQRWLHAQLAETNFRLLHELRQRTGAPSYPDARRLERTVDETWRAAVTVAASPEAPSLAAAVEQSAQTCRALVAQLLGANWRWPEGLPSGPRRE